MRGAPERRLGRLAGEALGPQIDQHQVVVGAAGHDGDSRRRCSVSASALAFSTTCLRVNLELRPQRLAEGDRLGGDDVHQRAALQAGEDRRIDLLGDVLVVGEDHARRAGPRSVLCVVVVTTWACGNGEGCAPPATSPAKCAMSTMRIGADLVGDLAEPREIPDSANRPSRRR